MIFALPALGFAVVLSFAVRRLKCDLEEEKAFRQQLQGIGRTLVIS